MRGGEKVLSEICAMFPHADLFTLVYVPGSCNQTIENRKITASFINRLPAVRRYYRYLLPLFPTAIENLDVSQYELIISSSHCVAKGVRKAADATHICYCYSPMRYIWAQKSVYSRNMGLSGMALCAFNPYLRRWDLKSNAGVDAFIADSLTVAKRIQDTYNRHADVVYPSVDTEFYTPADVQREDFYLMVTALAPYKCAEHAIDAAAKLGRKLIIIGTGQQMKKLKKTAPNNVVFMGWQSNEVIRDHYRRCSALLFPGEEDFGIVPLEAMSCGAPVIAYGAGGATETVSDMDNKNNVPAAGILYTPQTPDALADAIAKFESNRDRFSPQQMATLAARFDYNNFRTTLRSTIAGILGREAF